MKLHDKLDKIIELQHSQDIKLAQITVDLQHHIKRSDQHEEHLKRQDKKINKIWYILVAGAAAGVTEYGSVILKFLGGMI